MSETSPSRASKLLKVLDLKQIEENLYQGQNETENGSRLFGGQGIGVGDPWISLEQLLLNMAGIAAIQRPSLHQRLFRGR